MKKETNKKSYPLWLKLFIFVVKIPLIILAAGLNTISKEEQDSETIIDKYKRDSSILDISSPHHRYPSEH